MIEVPTRERLVTEAMRLFCEQGYRATSVAQIEAAAGLAPGSGALYHHFKSKEALLDAGIDRQLDRRRSMRDIRMLFRGVGDLRTDLTLLGRYLTAVIDEEQQFLTIAANTPGGKSPRLTAAYGALLHGLHADLSELAGNWGPDIPKEDIEAISVVGIDALLGNRVSILLDGREQAISDDRFLAEWTTMLTCRIEKAIAGT
ncbi:helix-turn-helix domain containing protein [Mycolicibacterium mucogenicum]|uniref:TetR/AcrR family transcriptional regulator n=1 Tax=Mycolicibacterium mucogenicum TaxID=56689 RepID=UPI00226A8E44|nr:TetR/AcrR family transcriptional regulator [Mycolicibacterium mucogenicum]MCX8553839.1 helix-turn-helix domain containing protein [Mycolicibacterium mucogenicum]